MNRAGARRWLFSSAEHRNAFIKTLEHVLCMDEIQIHAYCLMGNHYHLLVRTLLGNLSQAMQQLGSMFTNRLNRFEKLDRPLFRGRFKSKIVGHLIILGNSAGISIAFPKYCFSDGALYSAID